MPWNGPNELGKQPDFYGYAGVFNLNAASMANLNELAEKCR